MPLPILEFLVETIAPILMRVGLYFLEKKYPGIRDVVGSAVESHKAGIEIGNGVKIDGTATQQPRA